MLKAWIHFATLGGLFSIGVPLNVFGFFKLHKIFLRRENSNCGITGDGIDQEFTFRSRTTSSAVKRHYSKESKEFSKFLNFGGEGVGRGEGKEKFFRSRIYV